MRSVKPLDAAVGAAHCNNRVTNSRYTKLNFLPKNLKEQFQRPLNLYFLFVAMLQFIPAIAPVNPLSTLLPLLFAFTLTAVKEGYDDVRRHREDAEYNARPRQVLRGGVWVSLPSEEIRVGDVIRVNGGEDLPCDLVAIGAPHDCNGVVHIRTENLDGEMDLKSRDVASIPSGHGTTWLIDVDAPPGVTDAKLRSSGAAIVCPPPCASLSSFDARIEITAPGSAGGGPSTMVPLNGTNLLPQSCLLKNTAFVIGVAVYTGNESKCSMNKRDAPVKWAKVDQAVSNYSKIIFACQLTVATIFGIIGYATNSDLPERFWYLRASGTSQDWSAFLVFPFRFFLLTSVMIPISFKFVVDMSKFFVSMILRWDLSMYDDDRETGVHVKNSGIVEDLGQVEYVLTDKTGTLTENVMNLRGASVGGEKVQWSASFAVPPRRDDWDAFATALCICNTIQIETATDGTPMFVTVSPDEEALCRGAGDKGFVLQQRTRGNITMSTPSGSQRTYAIHHIFPFSSEKKCMSAVVEDERTKVIKLICKGADDKVLSLLSDASTREVYKCREHLTEFADLGLRTLVFAERTLTPAELDQLKQEHQAASVQLDNRGVAIDAVRARFEKGLQLIGASAIEDKLQEDLPSVLADLQEANVRVWMLTGDKIETAQQIAISCGLMSTVDERIHVHGDLWREVLSAARVPTPTQPSASRAAMLQRGSFETNEENRSNGSAESDDALVGHSRSGQASSTSRRVVEYADTGAARQPPGGTVMVVEGGNTLDKILVTPELAAHFRQVAMGCKSVICARVTPSQKAQITELVTGSGRLTLAIGDGGNDVAMIQAAHVGVGIIGKEGQQAARAADFAITKFKHLATLMFVHGHMSYRRTCYVVQYSFYKSMLISFIQLAYNSTTTLWSGVSFWDSFSLTAWNGLYTLPPILLYCFDRCAPRATLQSSPALYRLSQRGYGLTRMSFFAFVLRGMAQSALGLWLVFGIFSGDFISSAGGATATGETTYTVAYAAFVVLQLFTVIIESSSITFINGLAIALMPLCYVALTAVYSSIPRLGYYGVFARVLNDGYVAGAMLIVAVLFLPHYAFAALRTITRPNALEIARKLMVVRLEAEARRKAAASMPSRYSSGSSRWIGFVRYVVARALAEFVTSEDSPNSHTPDRAIV